MLPLNTQTDYTSLMKEAKLLCKRFKPIQQTRDTRNAKNWTSDQIGLEGLLKDVVVMSKV